MIVKAEHLHGFVITAGFYETRVAYYSWRGAPGYTFASIYQTISASALATVVAVKMMNSKRTARGTNFINTWS
jgi:hypothetical protein